jgi:hypothetical protein
MSAKSAVTSFRSPFMRSRSASIFPAMASGALRRSASSDWLRVGTAGRASASVPVIWKPQLWQNLASGLTGVWQFEQTRSSGCPQFSQNFASDLLLCEQLGHFI